MGAKAVTPDCRLRLLTTATVAILLLAYLLAGLNLVLKGT